MKKYRSANLPLPLLILLFASFFAISSCEWFKPARDSDKEKVYTDDDLGDLQGTKVFDPETGEWRTVREVNGEVDTIEWKVLDEKKYPPIISDGSWANSGTPSGNTGTTTPVAGGTYNVSLILPFLASQSPFSEINQNSLWAVHYYAGAKLAYDDLAIDGVSLNVSVADSDGSTAKVSGITRNNSLNNSSLIIGPYKRDNVKILERFSKETKTPLAVPYTANLGNAVNNPNYIQLNPSLKSHCEAITNHARDNFRTDNITLVSRDRPEEKARFAYFQNANAEIEGTLIGSKFKELVVDEEKIDPQTGIDVTPYINQGRTSVFIIPSWSSEPFVYSFLRQLMIEQAKGEDIVVYGMPQWMDYEQIDYDFYRKLKVHVSSAFYLDKSDERVRQFKQRFFNTYGAIPNDEAFMGYDAMMYFGKMLNRYGKDFPKSIDAQPFDVLSGRYEFNRVVLDPSTSNENLEYYDQLENKFVHILQFRDFQFQPAF